MKLSNFISGLQILSAYYEKDDYCIGAEHDQFFAYRTLRLLSDEDVAKMRELGWFQSETAEDKYDPDDGWTTYV